MGFKTHKLHCGHKGGKRQKQLFLTAWPPDVEITYPFTSSVQICAKDVVPVHVTLTNMHHQISSRRTHSRRLSVSQRTHTRRLYVICIIFLSNFKWGFILDQNLVIAVSEKRRLKISSWHRFPTDSSRGKLKIELLSHGKTVCCGLRRHRRE